jgi:radical SAM superfamily enzyme YgiQ (UPF0313 family)
MQLLPCPRQILERVHRVQQHGIDVWCGMIVGFDHDDPSIFDVMPKFLAEARISAALISMLHAIPTTPLYDRLKHEGRLNDDDASDKYRLTPPTQLTLLISVVLVIIAVILHYTGISIPLVGTHTFGVLLIGYLVLLAGNLIEGI